MVEWNWSMVKVGVLVIMWANSLGWMKKLTGSTLLGVITSMFMALIMWENEVILYGTFVFLYGLGFWNQLITNISERYVRSK